jgi:hypothetical protein
MEDHNKYIKVGDFVKDQTYAWVDWYRVHSIGSDDLHGKYILIEVIPNHPSETRYYFNAEPERHFLIKGFTAGKRERPKRGFGKWISKIEGEDA